MNTVGKALLVCKRVHEQAEPGETHDANRGPECAGSWEHERVRLEPLNPAFEAWDLDPEEDRFRVIAEFVQVLY